MSMPERLLPHNVLKCHSLQEAVAALETRTVSGARTIPGVVFWQGRRMFFSSAIGFPVSRHFLDTKPVDRKSLRDKEVDAFQAVKDAFNRSLDPSHHNEIRDYLVDNSDLFILPPMIVNADENVSLVCAGDPTTTPQVLAWLIIDDQFSPVITDGQHRHKGITEALVQKNAQLRFSSIGLMVSFEQAPEQMHQDFADCAKTKQISPSLMQVFDRRASSGRIVQHLIDHCPLFAHGKVDPEGKSITKGSIKLFLHNQVVGFVKGIVSDRRSSTVEFEESLTAKLKDDPEFQQRIIAYVNDLTAAIEPYRAAAALSTKDRDRIPAIREVGWIPLTSAGLAMLGMVGRELLALPLAEYTSAINRLATVDWKVTGPLWVDNLSIARDAQTGNVLRVQTGAKFIEAAARRILVHITPQTAAAA